MSSSDMAGQLSFRFQHIGEPGFMDQTLSILNTSQKSVVIEAEVEGLDASGVALPNVQVESAYGATDGHMVVGPGENVDVLAFRGADAASVRDVRVTDVSAMPVESPAWPTPVDAAPLDDYGRPLAYPAGFSKVALQNPNDEDAGVRVVAIIWNNPEAGQSQQALKVLDLSTLVSVPAEGKLVIDVDRAARKTLSKYESTNTVSLKAYYSL